MCQRTCCRNLPPGSSCTAAGTQSTSGSPGPCTADGSRTRLRPCHGRGCGSEDRPRSSSPGRPSRCTPRLMMVAANACLRPTRWSDGIGHRNKEGATKVTHDCPRRVVAAGRCAVLRAGWRGGVAGITYAVMVASLRQSALGLPLRSWMIGVSSLPLQIGHASMFFGSHALVAAWHTHETKEGNGGGATMKRHGLGRCPCAVAAVRGPRTSIGEVAGEGSATASSGTETVR